ncbi:hypothetical protein ACIRLA_45410 [Streptomyces sp. NPDC102364]
MPAATLQYTLQQLQSTLGAIDDAPPATPTMRYAQRPAGRP